jgi:hypothetical protein
MGLSGVTTITYTRDQLITDAFLEMGVIGESETPSNDMITRATRTLNAMMKEWVARGVGLWLNQRFTMALAYQTESYLIGPSGWHCTTSMTETALSADAASAATSISVDSITGISNGDYIGIQLDGGTMQWTTVNGAPDPAGPSVTLTNALTGAASEDAVVFAYTTKVNRPLGVVNLNVRDVNGNEIELFRLSREEYMALPLKSSLGKVVNYYYDPQLTNARLFVWPTCQTVSDRLVGTFKMPIQIFVNATDNPEFPEEYYSALKFGLSVQLSTAYHVPDRTFSKLVGLADSSFSNADQFDREEGSVYFAPGY